MILVVDDDAGLLRTLSRGLKARGFSVETAVDGETAFSRLVEGDCECMVLDMGMPRLNGAELLMLMQTEHVEVPVIVITGFADFSEQELSQFANVKKLISKPFMVKDLAEAVNDCVSRVLKE